MKPMSFGSVLWILAAGLALGWGCAQDTGHDDHGEGGHGGHDEGPGHAHGEAKEAPRGPKGGRLFAKDGLQLELHIEEQDGPPVFVAWLYDEHGKLLDPEGAELMVTLRRLGDRATTIHFRPAANHLRGDKEVTEPHSFRATVELKYQDKRPKFVFEQHEFRVELTPEAVERASIRTGAAAPGHIDVKVSSPGEVRLNSERMLVVRPRFPGVVAEMRKRLGDPVAKGDILAVIQSNNSLTEYTIKAPMAGQIVARSGMVGAAVDNGSVLYTLADLSSVWVDFAIYPQHVGVIKSGQPVTVTAATQPDLVAESKVSYVGPLLEEDTRVSHARIELPNPEGRWQPGLYVDVMAIVDHADVSVSVPDAAIFRSQFGPAVFIADGATFEVQPVTPGRSDGRRTEIIEGLDQGAVVVVKNTYLLKAELGRAEATHDH